MANIQNFKGDDAELKIRAVGEPLFDQVSSSLDDFYQNGFSSSAFLLMLYDQKRLPFWQRVKREAFISFISQALANFPVAGTFEGYLFILRAIFGADSEINFDVTGPGKLTVDVNATSSTEFTFIGRENADGVYSFFDMVDYDLTPFAFRGLSGIETQAELALLFSEIMPAGISPTIILTFFTRYDFIGSDSGGISNIIDSAGNQITFIEIGG